MKNRLQRRRFIKDVTLLTGATFILPGLPTFAANINTPMADKLTLDASARPVAARTDGFRMGTNTNTEGHTITLDSRSLLRDGKPWILISGEFHFSRCPEQEWRDELLKMKAGGVSMITTYIFWIHHEEEEGKWNWTGQRSLRKFITTCKEVGLTVLLRIGPWCHGEVRNGGFPDWLQKMGDEKVFELRRDNPGYLDYVKKLYVQIDQQMKGLLWKEGGPVIAVQLENEYSGPTQHLMTLKQMAQAVGLDVPLYTCTGWGGGGAAPYGEMVPFSGAYAEGFWDRSLTRMPGGYAGVFRFSGARRGNAAAMGAVGAAPAATNTPPPNPDVYPFFTCEQGAGMMASYHRRVLIYPEDTESMALVKLGSGANLLGFYMYHGGQNPEGKLSYLNETQASGYWNDLPVKNYDFQAPIGQYGQQREHYHWLRQLGLFMKDFGPGLSGMTSRPPITRGALNWAVRSDGNSGYLFVSHYQRLSPQPNVENAQFQIKFAGGDVLVPSLPVTIPYNSRFFWPVNLALGGVKLSYATAQPIASVNDRNIQYTVFKQTATIPAEFVLDESTATITSTIGKIERRNGQAYVGNVQPGLGAAIRLTGKDGKNHIIILLDEATSMDIWKGEWHGQERLFLTHANLLIDGPALRLRTENQADCSIAILPAPLTLSSGGRNLQSKEDGLFRRFSSRITSATPVQAIIEPVKPAGPPRIVPIAPSVPTRKEGMAMQPEDAEFAQAGVWTVKLPAGVAASRQLRLRIRYTGDVIRAYIGDKLIDDDFYSGRPLEIGLQRYGLDVFKNGITLKVLPLRKGAPISFTDDSGLKFDTDNVALSLNGVDVIETHEVRLTAG